MPVSQNGVHGIKVKMKKTLKIFYGCSIIAIIATGGITNAATTNNTDAIVVDNNTSRFNTVLSEMGASTTDSSGNALAETIRRQRAMLDAEHTKTTDDPKSPTTAANACDKALRDCMTEKCGTNFTKCASDSTTVWGNKMDSCRRNTKCTGHEYTLLAPEILADRNASIELSYYQSITNCGDAYNKCIFKICGNTMKDCLSKSAGDSAILECKSIADQCKEQDSGLAARAMAVFGDLRTIAAADVQKQEKRLYELRDLMRAQCNRFGAMFDERTLDCVYTVNFFAGDDTEHPMSSKKLYAGSTFQCTPDWFGIDITTYIENAQRLTRSQTSASAAAMGAGFGTAAGLWTSGAVTRGIATQESEAAAKEACIAEGGEWVSAGFLKGNKCDMTNAEENRKKATQEQRDQNEDPNKTPGETPAGQTPCEAYENLKCSDHKEKCEWIQATATTPGYCRTKGSSYTPEQTLSINEAQCNALGSGICDNKVNCEWIVNANDGRGKCVAKTDSTTESNIKHPAATTNSKTIATAAQLDTETDGINWCSTSVSRAQPNSNGLSICKKERNGYWAIQFPYGIVTGASVCSPTKETKNSEPAKDQYAINEQYKRNHIDINAIYCYCKMEQPKESKWVITNIYSNAYECGEGCAELCADMIKDAKNFRKVIFQN